MSLCYHDAQIPCFPIGKYYFDLKIFTRLLMAKEKSAIKSGNKMILKAKDYSEADNQCNHYCP